MRPLIARFLCSVSLLVSFATLVSAQPLATQPIVSGLAPLVGFVQDPIVPNTFYLVQQEGTIRVFQNGAVLPTPFLNLTGEIVAGGEQGLLGMAFAPADPRRVFVYFTNPAGDIVVARFTRSEANRLVAIVETRKDLVWSDDQAIIPHQGAGNHNGGQLAFGPDGYLYLAPGDGGGGNDTFGNAQNVRTLLGKMLRIDVNVPDDDPKGYRVPPDNPFLPYVAQFGVRPEIWSFGLRNPWRFSFDNPALGGSGALLIADVGQGAREEINYEPRGAGGRNYGWPAREGKIAAERVDNPPMVPLPLTDPIVDYDRDVGTTVTGGYVYRGSALPAFRGRYFYGDFGSGRVFSVGPALVPVEHPEISGFGITSFAEDLSGELYIVRINGTVRKIVPSPSLLPQAPAGFTANVAGSKVLLTWQPPAGALPTSYRLEAGLTPGGSDVLVTTLPGNVTEVSATNVPDGRYFVRLRGVNAAGTGPASDEVDVRVGCAGPPPAPTFLNQDVTATRVVTLRWGASPGATGYVIEVGSQPGAANVAIAQLGPDTGLSVQAPQGTFYVRIRARNACGGSAPSPQATVVVP